MNRLKVFLLILMLLVITTSVIAAQGVVTVMVIPMWRPYSASTLSGGSYQLSAIAGQPEVSPPLRGAGYSLTGGGRPGGIFGGPPATRPNSQIFLPVAVRTP